jgi:hypothetical protein
LEGVQRIVLVNESTDLLQKRGEIALFFWRFVRDSRSRGSASALGTLRQQ